MAWDTPTLATVGQVLTAAFWNAEVKGNMDYLKGGMASYTPTLTQSGSVAHTVNEARHSRTGDFVDLTFNLTVTGTGTTNNAITVSLPVAATGYAAFSSLGHGLIGDLSVPNLYNVTWALLTTTTVQAYTNVAGSAAVGVSPAFALANTDLVRGTLRYHVA